MAVSSTTSKVSYTASASQTVFAYTFKIFADADLKVYVNDVLKTLTTDYTVSDAGETAGGNVTFGTGLSASDSVVIERVLTLTQGTDYVENDPFPAETHEDALDRLTFITQQHQDALDRTVKFATTVTDVGDVEVLGSATARASKLFAFDSSGGLDITQEIGVYKGGWAATTAYVVRDIVKDTGNNNIYICNTVHTASGALPISSNADSAKWDLIVDAAAAATSATAAATSATAAASSATAAASSASAAATSKTGADAAQTAAETAQTAAETAETNAETAETNAETAETNAETAETNAASSATAAASSATSASTSASTATTKATAAASSATAAASSATAAATSATNAATSATTASTQATNAATSATTATTQASTATTQATAAAASATAAAASADAFDDVYLGAKASDPTLDNDGDALTAGDMYFNTGTDRMRVYSGSAWADVALDSATIVTKTSATGSGVLPAGTTAQRDGSPSAGYLRWNTTDTSAEVYDGSAWAAVGGGNTTDEGLYEHSHTISANYSITSGNNALTAGPITINTGVSVTVPTGSTWVIA